MSNAQVIVAANGDAGMWVEHTGIDGPALQSWIDFVEVQTQKHNPHSDLSLIFVVLLFVCYSLFLRLNQTTPIEQTIHLSQSMSLLTNGQKSPFLPLKLHSTKQKITLSPKQID